MDALRTDDPRWLGSFALFARLGAGGMGQVYLGRATNGRLVAVKAVHASYSGDPSFRARFAQEIETAVQVRAPWTAAVLDADPAAPRPWLATEYVAGPSLEHTVSDTGPLAPDAVGVLAGRLAEALAGLHARDVVHRDLTPSNVLLDHHGPRLVDFGVARAADSTQLTGAGIVVGTPAFMSPEQASGGDVGTASDVFSWASVVLFAATGAGPYGEASSPMAMLYRVTSTEPDISGAPDWLRGLLAPCLDKDPAKRPEAAELVEQLAERAGAADVWPTQAVVDLARKQAAELVAAEWAHLEETGRAATTTVGQVPAAATQVVTQVVRPLGIGPLPGRPSPADRPSGAGHPAGLGPAMPGSRIGGLSTGAIVGITLGAVVVLLMSVLGVITGMEILGGRGAGPSAAPVQPLQPLPGPAPNQIGNGRLVGSVSFPNEAPRGIAVSPDSRRAYVATGNSLSVIDRSTGSVTVRVEIAGTPSAVAVARDGRIYVGSLSGFVTVLDGTSYQPVATYPVNLLITAMALGRGDRTLYLGGMDRGSFGRDSTTVTVMDAASGRVSGTINVGGSPTYLGATPDGSRVLVAGRESLSLVDTAANSVVASFPISGPRALTIAPDGSRAYVAGGSNAVQVVDPRTSTILGEIRTRSSISGAAVSPTGRYLFLAATDYSGGSGSRNTVQVVDTATSFTVERIPTNTRSTQMVATPDGQRLFLGGNYNEPLAIVDPAGRR